MKDVIGLSALLFFGCGMGLRAADPEPPGLSIPVKLDIQVGPLQEAVKALHAQTGLDILAVPELLPPAIAVPAFSYKGPLGRGLTRFLAKVKLVYKVGPLGGILMLDPKLKLKGYTDWLLEAFPNTAGLLIRAVNEQGRKLDLRPGDILIGLDGERFVDLLAFRHYAMASLKAGQEVTASVKRGAQIVQIKSHIEDPRGWLSDIGARGDYDISPSIYMRYSKAGHRDPKWNAQVEKFVGKIDAINHVDNKWLYVDWLHEQYAKIEALGCSDPLVFQTYLKTTKEYDDRAWQALMRLQPKIMRGVFGGAQALARVLLASDFLKNGPASVRRSASRWAEYGFVLLNQQDPDPHLFQARRVGHALSTQLWMEGDVPAYLALWQALKPRYLQHPHQQFSDVFGNVQALAYQGRYDEALKFNIEYARSSGGIDFWSRSVGKILDAVKQHFQGRPPRVGPSWQGPAGLLSWRTLACLDALNSVARKFPLPGHAIPKLFPKMTFARVFAPNAKLPDRYEIFFFPKIIRHTFTNDGAGLALDAGGAGADPARNSYPSNSWYNGSRFQVNDRRQLIRFYNGIGAVFQVPLFGLVNDYRDVIHFTRAPGELTVRCNHVWQTTDCAPGLLKKGQLCFFIRNAAASCDHGVLISTDSCYDNDGIRERAERIINPKAELTPVARMKLWNEIEALSPPDNMWARRRIRRYIPGTLKNKAGQPKPNAAGVLHPLTTQQAKARFQKRGPVKWMLEDPQVKDHVWCARPNGKLEIMSKVRYFTTYRPFIRDWAGQDTAIGTPVFTKDAVWFPTDNGLFRYARRAQVFKHLPLGGVFFEVPIKSVLVKGTRVTVEVEAGRPVSGIWNYDLKSRRWTLPRGLHVPFVSGPHAEPSGGAQKTSAKKPRKAAPPKRKHSKASIAARLLLSARNYLKNNLREMAKSKLQALLKDFPNSSEAGQAKELLDELK